jgi:hypothetical protein
MFEVEIKVKRIDEQGTYYEIVPIGELHDKLAYCGYFVGTDEEILTQAKENLNAITIQ